MTLSSMARWRHSCPVVLGDPAAIKGDQRLPLILDRGRGASKRVHDNHARL